MRIPRRSSICPIDENDPLKYYFMPLVGWLFRQRLRMALRMLSERKFGRLLEIGYGSGVFLPALRSRCKELFGVDCHEKGERVRQMLEKEGIEAALQTGDVSHLDFQDGYFDAVVCMSTLEHLPDLDNPLREVKRVLNSEGKAIFGFPQKGTIMNALFRSIGFKGIENHHLQGVQDILESLKRIFIVEKVRTLPRFFPPRLSLYVVAGCRKENG